MKALTATDATLVHLNHSLDFNIEANAIVCQVGMIIKQNGQPVVHHCQKLSDAQKNYTTVEKELQSVVEMLHTFCSTLPGTKIAVHMDHKNFTHSLLVHCTACHALAFTP